MMLLDDDDVGDSKRDDNLGIEAIEVRLDTALDEV